MEKSLQDTIANLLKSIDGYSSAELGKAISRLQKAQTKAHKREKEEEERNRILEQEKKEQELVQLKQDPLVAGILNAFKGAKIEGVKTSKVQDFTDEPDTIAEE